MVRCADSRPRLRAENCHQNEEALCAGAKRRPGRAKRSSGWWRFHAGCALDTASAALHALLTPHPPPWPSLPEGKTTSVPAGCSTPGTEIWEIVPAGHTPIRRRGLHGLRT